MIKAVIFDMDGVVVKTGLIHFNTEKKVLNEIGINLSREYLASYNAVAADVYFKDILKKHNKSVNLEELLEKKYRMVYDILKDGVPVIPGVLELIQLLKKNHVKTALASGSPAEFVDFILSKLNLKKSFDTIVSLGDIKHSKPDPEIFLLAAKRMNVDPKYCLVIEDAYLGVLAARNAGMKCIGFINEESGDQDLSKADLIVDDLNGLTLDKIQKL
jgi:beta-phosphoglucomutase family hydrolase